MLKRRHLKPTTDKYNRKHVINYVGIFTLKTLRTKKLPQIRVGFRRAPNELSTEFIIR